MLWILFLPFVFGDRLSQEENAELQSMCGQRVIAAGKRFQRFTKTQEAKREEAPWVVHMSLGGSWNFDMNKTTINMRNVLCSGTLISSRHVLTVADCFNHTLIACKIRNETNDKNDTTKQILDFPIVVDENYLNQMMVIKSGRCTKNSCDFHEEPFSTKIKKVFIPSEYFLGECFFETYKTLAGNIAVIELEKNVPFSETVQPACLPENHPIVNETNFTIYGYDRSNELKRNVLRKCESTVKECNTFGLSNLSNACSNNPSGLGCHKVTGSGQIVFENRTAIVSAVLDYATPSPFPGFKPSQNDDTSVIVLEHSDWICEATGICRGTAKERLDLDEKWSLTKALKPELKAVEKPPKFITFEKVNDDNLDV